MTNELVLNGRWIVTPGFTNTPGNMAGICIVENFRQVEVVLWEKGSPRLFASIKYDERKDKAWARDGRIGKAPFGGKLRAAVEAFRVLRQVQRDH